MRRFLIHLGYSGTRLRGVQKAPDEGVVEVPASVQGHLEEGLRTLRSENLPLAYFSSRTDKGVHAINNTAHVDLCRRTKGLFYDPGFISKCLNTHFGRKDIDIRVHKTLAVPALFHARFNAVGRSYLYRLGVLKPGVYEKQSSGLHSFLPVQELHKLCLVRQPFDIEKFATGCQLLEGTHNFACFMGAPSKNTFPVNPVRAIESLTVTEGHPLFNPLYEPLYENFDIWDVNVSARSFLYNQVRRMVGALVALAQDRISLACMQQLLDNPAPKNWNTRASTAPAHGLYLLKVKYPPEAFEESFFLDDSSKKDESSFEN